MAEPLLRSLPLADGECEAVLHAVRWHNSKRADTPLLCVLRDADMLDGLGAIGIMRGFMSKGHLPPYEPGAPFETAGGGWPASNASDQILGQMRFYDWLNTETARRMAAERLDFMRAFVAQVRREVLDGGDGR
jgi:HD superfamily phosphodiesterase